MTLINLSHDSHKNFIESTLKTAHYGKHSLYIPLFPFMNVHQVEAQVLDPGEDDLSCGGGSDLGAAQNPLEVWTFT